MRKGCVSVDRETTWFSVIYSLRFYPYMETTGFMSVYYKNFVARETTEVLVLSTVTVTNGYLSTLFSLFT